MPAWRHPFTLGLLNQLANPKSVLFWGAMFPQFVDFEADNLWVPVRHPRRDRDRRRTSSCSRLDAVAATRGRSLLATGMRAVWRERISGGALVIVGGALSLVKHSS